ncbi:MAG: hypothetical protein KF779_10060 [Hyphomonadaceae bacterium]|nr:hypothetical protein [Hyphomonadaceae bacterium]
MRWSLAACLFVACCATPVAPGEGGEAYLPRSSWADEGDWEFKENWIGGQLRAMHEPSLLAASTQPSGAKVYRLVVVPPFSPAYAIRVTQTANGSGEVVFVQLDGQGGYHPGSVRRRIEFEVSRARMTALRDQFEATGFWNLPVEPRRPPSADEEEIICMDGTEFVFEAVVDGRHHLVMPDNCPDLNDDFARLASTFRQIANRPRY